MFSERGSDSRSESALHTSRQPHDKARSGFVPRPLPRLGDVILSQSAPFSPSSRSTPSVPLEDPTTHGQLKREPPSPNSPRPPPRYVHVSGSGLLRPKHPSELPSGIPRPASGPKNQEENKRIVVRRGAAFDTLSSTSSTSATASIPRSIVGHRTRHTYPLFSPRADSPLTASVAATATSPITTRVSVIASSRVRGNSAPAATSSVASAAATKVIKSTKATNHKAAVAASSGPVKFQPLSTQLTNIAAGTTGTGEPTCTTPAASYSSSSQSSRQSHSQVIVPHRGSAKQTSHSTKATSHQNSKGDSQTTKKSDRSHLHRQKRDEKLRSDSSSSSSRLPPPSPSSSTPASAFAPAVSASVISRPLFLDVGQAVSTTTTHSHPLDPADTLGTLDSYRIDSDDDFSQISALNALDDLARWDMDHLPISSPSDSTPHTKETTSPFGASVPPLVSTPNPTPNPPSTNVPANSTPPTRSAISPPNSWSTSSTAAASSPTTQPPTSFVNPFAEPLDDDALLAAEDDYYSSGPPPSPIRPKVVMEQMGVKKSKMIAAEKARSGANVGISRHVPFPGENAVTLSHTTTKSRSSSMSSLSSPPQLLSLSGSAKPSPPPLPTTSGSNSTGLPPPLPVPLKLNGDAPHPLVEGTLQSSSYLRQRTPPPPPTTTSTESHGQRAVKIKGEEIDSLLSPGPVRKRRTSGLSKQPSMTSSSSPSTTQSSSRSSTPSVSPTSTSKSAIPVFVPPPRPLSASKLDPKAVSCSPPGDKSSDSGYCSAGPKALRKKKAFHPSITPASESKKDGFGYVHLAAKDCELSITFPTSNHYEVWDMSDGGYVAIPIMLCLMVKPGSWAGQQLAMPDVTLIDLQCDDVPLSPMSVRSGGTLSSSFSAYSSHDQPLTTFSPPPYPSAVYPHSSPPPSTSPSADSYTVSFLGGKSALDPGASSGARGPPLTLRERDEEQNIGADRISLDGRWTKVTARPGVEGRITHRVPATSSTRTTPRTPPVPMSGFTSKLRKPSSVRNQERGWFLKTWISIPMRLFLKRETRSFRIRAKLWMMGDEEKALGPGISRKRQVHADESSWFSPTSAEVGRGFDKAPGCQCVGHPEEEEEHQVFDFPFPLEAQSEMTVSHLRREREMDPVWW